MTRIRMIALSAAVSLFAVNGWSQTNTAHPASPQRHISEGIDLDAHLPEDRVPASHSIRFEEGLELLSTNSLDVESARQALVTASILEDQARAAFAPTVNLSGRLAINDPVVKMAANNPLAPLTPYLESVYANDPDLRDFLANNPDVPDARDIAGVVPDEVIVNPRFDYRATLTVRQPLYNGRFFPARRLADLVQRQADAVIEQVTFATQQAYTQIYFQAVGLQRYSDIAKANVETARITLERAQALFNARAGSEVDLTRAEVSYLTALSDYENANISYALAIEAMASLLRVDADFDVIEPPEMPAPSSLTAVIDTAFQSRAELAVADLDVEMAEIEKKSARAGFQPYIFAEGQGTAARVTAFTGRAITWNVSLNLSWDLWDGGASRRAVRTAEVTRYQAEIRREQLEDRIRTEIRSAWLTMQTQGNLVQRATSTAKLAQINYDVTVRARDLGSSSALEIDVAQNALFQAQLALADAEMQYRAAIYELYRLQGNAQDLTSVVTP